VTDDEIRLRIRQLLDDGTLPRDQVRSVAVRRTGGASCVACGVVFDSGESGYEVTTPRGLVLLLHRRCLELWATLIREEGL
jgi:hypothetical protein